MASASDTLSLCKILSESKRIIRDHLRHFQALTLLFVFPISLCFIIYPTILTTFLSPSQSNSINISKSQNQYLILNLFYSVFVSLLSLCAVATISYSTYNGFDGQPVSLIASIKSIFSSFWPILSTILVSDLIWALIFIPFMLLELLVYKWLDSSYFLPFVIFITLVFVVVLIYLQVNWMLAYAVVVVESKWGYEPLQRSADLIKGNKGVALSMLLFFGLINGGFFLVFYGTRLWRRAFLLYLIFGSLYLSLFLLLNLVGTVVLYVLCREMHEGLPFENHKKCSLLK